MWTAQEFCSSTNNWGVRVVQLLAPPPVIPTLCTPSVVGNELSINVVVTGTVVNGSGFFDPGTGFPNHISASLPGGIVVNSVTYDSPTQVTLNLNTTGVADGFYDVTVTNPDGQSAVGMGILEIDHTVPVELTEFTGNIVPGNKILLEWKTATEVNNYGFELQRSEFDLQSPDWKKITFVEGYGNSNSPKEYSFLDEGISYGKYLYRLKQIDNDGTFEYSSEIEVDADELPNGLVLEQNYPNPFNPSTTIRFAIDESVPAVLQVYDALGNQIAELFNEQTEAGKIYNLEFEGGNLSSGIYFYKLETPSHTIHKKMLLIK
jgi:hypothetical protein